MMARPEARASIATVLLVDDEAYLLEEMAEVLQNDGYRCLTANSANKAYELIQQEDDIDLVVTDIRMPGLDGVEFIREMKNKSRREQNLAMVVLSGHAGFDEAVRAMRAGAEDFLTKPASADALLGAIRRALTLTALRRTESLFREGMASQAEEKTRTIEQLQDTLRGKNRYIEALETSCQLALNHTEYFCKIANEITASAMHQIATRTDEADNSADQSHALSAETMNGGVHTLQICANMGQGMSATDFILGRTGFAACTTELQRALDPVISRRGLILEIESEQNDRPTGSGTLEFMTGTCAAAVSAATRADLDSRIKLVLNWQGQRPMAKVYFSGRACSDEELDVISQPRIVRRFAPSLDPSLYIARRMLGAGGMKLECSNGGSEPHCFTIGRQNLGK